MLLPVRPPSEMTGKLKVSYKFVINALKYLEAKGYSYSNYDRFVAQHHQHDLQSCSLLLKKPDWLKQHLFKFEQDFPSKVCRETMLEFWKEDVRFYRRHKKPGFELQFITEGMSGPNKDKTKTYFSSLYDTIFKITNLKGENFRSLFREEYSIKNFDYRFVCPACLGYMDIYKAQLDHYFPVHYFPSLTIHPYNLIPICPSCNTAIGSKETKGKGGNIPGDQPKPDMLRELLLPYRTKYHKKIRVEFTGSAGRRKVRLTAIKKGKPLLVKQVENHSKLYNLDNEWSRRLPYLYERLLLQMCTHFRSIKKKDNAPVITLSDIRLYLEDFILRGSEEKLFRVSDEFLFVSFVAWLYKNQGPLKALRDDLNKRLPSGQSGQDFPYIWNEYEDA